MLLRDLLAGDADVEARFAACEVTGITADSRKVRPATCSSRCREPRPMASAFVPAAVKAGARAIIAENAPASLPDRCRLRPGRECAALARIGRSALLSAPAEDDRGGHRHQRQDLGRCLHAPDLGRARSSSGEHRHGRDRLAGGRSLRLADHAGPGRSASHARSTRRRRRHASGAGGFLARSRSAPPRRRAGRRSAAITNLSRDHLDYHSSFESLSRGEASPVRVAHCAGRGRCRQCRRRRRQRRRRGCAEAQAAGSSPWARSAPASGSLDVTIDGFSQRLSLVHDNRTYAVRLPLVGDVPGRERARGGGPCHRDRQRAGGCVRRARTARRRQGPPRAGRRSRTARPVFVDYAHKPDALAKALDALRPLRHRRASSSCSAAAATAIAGKRPMMGEIAAAEGRPASSSPTTIRAARIRPRSAPPSSPLRPGAIEIGDRGAGHPRRGRGAEDRRRAAGRRQGP